MIAALIAAVLIFVGDQLVFSPFTDWREQLLVRRDAADNALADAHRILQLQEELRPLSRSMATSLNADASTVESQLLHLLHEWQQHAGVTDASFQRLRSVQAHGYTCLTFNVSASGGMGPIATLLYNIETASIPLRIDNIRLTPKRDGKDDLQVRLNISTLCRAAALQTSAGTTVANVDATGGQP
jgi:hypothetical protein